MDRVFLDANVLFSAAYESRRKIGRLWKLSNVELVTSAYAAAEALRNISRKRPDRLSALSRLMSTIGLTPEAISLEMPSGVSLPSKDVPILLAAIAARATHLLTGDHHFGPYFGRSIGGVKILTPAQYLGSKSNSGEG